MMDEKPELKLTAFETNDGAPGLQESVVALVDFLGFSRKIRQAEEEARANELLRVVHKFLNTWHFALTDGFPGDMRSQRDWDIKFFTDNIVIGRPIRPERGFEMGLVIEELCLFQIDAVCNDFFLRGGVAVGNFFMDEHVVFGVPLLDAHKAEKCSAKSPRIVLASSARELVAASILSRSHAKGSPYYHGVIQDEEDGELFLNYLDACFHDYTEPPEFTWITAHRAAILRRIALHQHDQEILRKYEWSARYHNFWCESWHIPEYRIDGFESLQVRRLSEAAL
jgi:hypothetical protein